MNPEYIPQNLEAEVQKLWNKQKSFEAYENSERPKYYCLSMLPYPSGKLHMGHVRNYTIGDVISRYKRMLGHNVLQPMGWDAFGLPAENAAIQRSIPPAEWTYQNIDNMKKQLQRMGFAYDWSREVTTCKSDYYQWEQWFFLRLFEKGLAYRKNAVVNWDPVDKTVLANEQVIDGKGWRSGAIVEKREIKQWFIRITAYADELLEELDHLNDWPESVKAMQRNWIGRSKGVEVEFSLSSGLEPLKIFTTRPDTIFGATFMAVAADHPLALEAAKKDKEIAIFLENCRNGSVSEVESASAEKKGIPLGIEAINPLNNQLIPVWVANFVLIGYGTGAVMAVPGHDERDHAFAKQYGLPIVQVIGPKNGADDIDIYEQAWTAKENIVTINSGEFSNLDFDSAFQKISNFIEQKGIGRKKINYRLRDWGVSRQRYWGCPIPVIHCSACGIVPVPDHQLPVVLPESVIFSGVQSPLKNNPEWLEVTCPSCGDLAKRETDTFDTFVESSWYYARYCSSNSDAMLDERANYWLPVDHYIGGIEHAVMHLLYFRFWHKLMRDLGLVESNEPAKKLLCQGMVLAEAYYQDTAELGRVWLSPDDIKIERDEKGKVRHAYRLEDDTEVVSTGWTTMSKSKNNGVDPQDLVDRYGADTVRLFTMFASPPDQALEWNDDAVAGSQRFLRRLWSLMLRSMENIFPNDSNIEYRDESCKIVRRTVHTCLKKINRDMEKHQFNTVVAGCMEIFNILDDFDACKNDDRKMVLHESLSILIRVLAPITPHLCHVLWEQLGMKTDILDAPWPTADEKALISQEQTLVIQINGKLRGQICIASDANESTIGEEAMKNPKVAKYIGDKPVKKIIVVSGKLVNIVI